MLVHTCLCTDFVGVIYKKNLQVRYHMWPSTNQLLTNLMTEDMALDPVHKHSWGKL